MIFLRLLFALILSVSLLSCEQKKDDQNSMNKTKDNFKYQTEQFADVGILRYKIPGFNELSLKDKEFIYYLYEAALSGRDIIYDQNYKYNLEIRKTLETIVNSYKGDHNTDDFKNFMIYTKKVWFSNGIHHHYSNQKFIPGFSKEYFIELVENSASENLPLEKGEPLDVFLKRLTSIIFDPKIAPIKVNLTPDQDLITTSAVNFYEGVNEKEVENFYNKQKVKDDPAPVWYGLNSKLVKNNGKVEERKWMIGGMYSQAIEKIVNWLEKAVSVAENDHQKATLNKLIDFYKTGDLKTWDEYNIMWSQDTSSNSDIVNGFIEVYNDPMG